MKLLRYISSVLVVTLIIACNKVPDGIIQPQEMAELMADIHMGEAVIDANYSTYTADSSRMLLKQSILANKGYSLEDLDTSLVWYGGHLDLMKDIYENTSKILEERAHETLSNKVPSGAGLDIEAPVDSANIWQGLPTYFFSPTSSMDYLAFKINSDPSWQRGDSFTLRGVFNNAVKPVRWNISAEYTDGSIESLDSRFSGNGKHQLVFYTDSTKTASKVYGSIEFDLSDSKMIYVDSLTFIKKPLDGVTYPQRYKQKSEKFYNLNNNDE